MFICGTSPDCNLPLIEVPICSLECVVTDNKSGLMDKGGQHRVSSNNKFDRAFHSKVPYILLLKLKVLQILQVVILLDNTWNDRF